MALIKKVFPLVKGTEVAISYKNKFGNTVAENVNDKGLNFDDADENLRVELLKSIRAGVLVLREVEATVKKVTEDDFMKELNSFAKVKTDEKKTASVKTEAPKTTERVVEQTKPNTEVKPEVKHTTEVKTKPVESSKAANVEVKHTTEVKKEERKIEAPKTPKVNEPILNIKKDDNRRRGRK